MMRPIIKPKNFSTHQNKNYGIGFHQFRYFMKIQMWARTLILPEYMSPPTMEKVDYRKIFVG
jgi:hypothetical protein